jgi:hypothetical protein
MRQGRADVPALRIGRVQVRSSLVRGTPGGRAAELIVAHNGQLTNPVSAVDCTAAGGRGRSGARWRRLGDFR